MQHHPTHNRCPYTLKPLAELPKVSNEHIIADAIGGSDNYTVIVDAKTNSDFGTGADAAFIESPFLQMLRTQHGVKSRSGTAEWTLKGHSSDDGKPAEVTIPHAGAVSIRHKQPVEFDASRTSVKIKVAADKRDAFIAEMTENMKRKGKILAIQNEQRVENQKIDLQFSVGLDMLEPGILKIAYLAAYEYLGDVFLSDPLNPEWQKAIRSVSIQEDKSKIQCISDVPPKFLDAIFPVLAAHEHAVTVCNLQQEGPLIAVRLFNSGILTRVYIASNSSDFGLSVLEGKIVVCDAITKKLKVLRFEDHFVNYSNRMTAASWSKGGNL